MKNWSVVNRLTGEIVYAYAAETPTEWPGMEYASCNHIAAVDVPAPPPQRRLTKLQFIELFTDAEMATIYGAAKVSPAIEVWLAKFNLATPGQDGTSVDLNDPRTIAGINALEQGGLIGPGRAAEILA